LGGVCSGLESWGFQPSRALPSGHKWGMWLKVKARWEGMGGEEGENGHEGRRR